MDSEFPSNSQQNRPRPKEQNEKKVQQVVTGEVVRRKKPLGKRFKEMFIAGDAKSAWGHVTFEVIVPAAKDLFLDALFQGAERMVFPESRPRGRGRHGYGESHINYNYQRPYNRRDPRDEPRPQMSRRGRSSFNFDEIILPSRHEADEVLDQLFELISKFEVASVSDLYSLVGITANYTDEKYGWTDIRGSVVTRTHNGYLLDLPRPEIID